MQPFLQHCYQPTGSQTSSQLFPSSSTENRWAHCLLSGVNILRPCGGFKQHHPQTSSTHRSTRRQQIWRFYPSILQEQRRRLPDKASSRSYLYLFWESVRKENITNICFFFSGCNKKKWQQREREEHYLRFRKTQTNIFLFSSFLNNKQKQKRNLLLLTCQQQTTKKRTKKRKLLLLLTRRSIDLFIFPWTQQKWTPPFPLSRKRTRITQSFAVS